jgi:hypothetical protein
VAQKKNVFECLFICNDHVSHNILYIKDVTCILFYLNLLHENSLHFDRLFVVVQNFPLNNQIILKVPQSVQLIHLLYNSTILDSEFLISFVCIYTNY